MGQIAKGSRVVFQAAGPCGLGALEAAGEQGVWAIGVDVDQSSLGPHVLTSAVKRLDIAVFETVRRLVEDTLATGGTSVFALADGGVGLGAFNPRVPRTVLSRIEEVRAGIVAGSVDVELPDQTAQSSFPDGSFATPSGSYPPERIARSP
jgi:basic membrane protein A